MSRRSWRNTGATSARKPGRRAVLAALAAGVSLAGCSGAPGSGDGSDPESEGSPNDDGDGGAASSPEPTDATSQETPDSQGSGWRQFRADAANTGYAERTGPRGDAVRWRTDLPSAARAPVAVADGTAYVLTADGGLIAYRIGDGREQWQASLTVAPSTSPAVTDSGVFLATESGVARVSREGEPVWRRDLSTGAAALEPPRGRGQPRLRDGRRYASGAGTAAGPARRQQSSPERAGVTVRGDRLYTAIGSDVVALGTEAGGTLWRTGLESAPGTPALGEGGELRVCTDRHVVGLGSGGAVNFRTEIGEGLSAPAIADGIAYVATGQRTERERVVAVGPGGEVQWRTAPAESDVTPTRLAPVAGRLSRDPGGLGLGSSQVSYNPSSAPAVGPDGIYAGTVTGVAALTRDGTVRWRTALEGVEGDPVVVGDRVYAAADPGVVVLDRADGTERQRIALGTSQQAGAVAPRGRFAAARFQVETGPTASPAVADGVYVPVNQVDGGPALVAVD